MELSLAFQKRAIRRNQSKHRKCERGKGDMSGIFTRTIHKVIRLWMKEAIFWGEGGRFKLEENSVQARAVLRL
jgi:hypothetical protein